MVRDEWARPIRCERENEAGAARKDEPSAEWYALRAGCLIVRAEARTYPRSKCKGRLALERALTPEASAKADSR